MEVYVKKFLLSILVIACSGIAAFAWTDHTKLSYIIFADDPNVKETVPAESLDSFIEKEKHGLSQVLTAEEQWLRTNLPYYAPLPDSLRFSETQKGAKLHHSFIRAIRINPVIPIALYKRIPDGGKADPGHQIVSFDKVALPFLLFLKLENLQIEIIKPGERMSALSVLATAADEPDYGLDIGLYMDSKTAFGSGYGFGDQPFGNPGLAYATQAPFHMGFYHESPIISLAAPFTKKSGSEYRFNLFSALSSYAFHSGHPYWGYRFAGWALHYLQDSGVVYHERMLPGVSTFAAVKSAALGDKKTQAAFLNEVSNKHYLYEDYAFYALTDLAKAKITANPMIDALKDRSNDRKVPAMYPFYISEVSGAISAGRSDKVDAVVKKAFPAKFVSDSSYLYGVTEPPIDIYEYVHKTNPAGAAALEKSNEQSFRYLGSYSRRYIEWVKTGNISTTAHHKRSHVWPFVLAVLLIFAAAFFLIRLVRSNSKPAEEVNAPVEAVQAPKRKAAAKRSVKKKGKK
jgi:hypothetical protein